MIGRSLSHYRIVERLGAGGMGVVYKAHDTHLDRIVAIKTLPPERVADLDRKRRFVQEARAASALNHPNIITIYDIDQADGIDFIAMEYVAGKTLDQLVPRKGMRLPLALKYGVQIADALARAHGAGIIHRDLKPSNVMVDEHELVKVLDFGLAKLTQDRPVGDEAATRTAEATTEEGTIIGTVAYMSPEQVEGKPVDARSDVFSLGSVLYEMLTGRRTFQRESQASTLAAILRDEPEPVRQVVEGTPPEVERVLKRCLRKDRAQRFQHMDDLKVALEELRQESEAGTLDRTAPMLPARRRRWPLWTSAAAVLVALAAGGLWLGLRTPTPEAVLVPLPLTSLLGSEVEPQVSPDGKHVAFAWNGEREDDLDIYVQLIGSDTPLRLTTDPGDEFSPAWSPDGRNLAFLRATPGRRWQILVISAFGGVERNVGETARWFWGHGFEGPEITWTPDGQSLVFLDADREGQPAGLSLLSLQGGEKRVLTLPPAGVLGDTGPAFSPIDGSLAFRRVVAYHFSDIFVLPLGAEYKARGEPRRLTHGVFAATPAWSPDGREIVYAEGRFGNPALWRVAADGGVGPRRLPVGGEGAMFPSVSRPARGLEARLVYAQWSWRVNVWEATVAGKESPVPRVVSTRRDYEASYSPDGRRISFKSDRSGSAEVWTCLSDGTQALRLTEIGTVQYSQWSPDGAFVLFSSGAEGQQEIYTVNANGTALRRLTNHPALDWQPVMARDRKWIFFASNRTGRFEIWKMPAGGGDALQFTRNGGWCPKESADGKDIYYTRASAGGLYSVWRQPAARGNEEMIVDQLVHHSCYDVGAGWIYFISRGGPAGESSIQRRDLRTGRTETITRMSNLLGYRLAVSPDEKHILFERTEVDASDLHYVEHFR